jgi:outer membrane protein OmpA-like peptidoglycan-associated protein
MHTSGSCWTGFWLGCGAAVFLTLAAMFGPHPVSLAGVEARLKTQVEKALTRQGFSEIAVEMDGQTAILSGGVGSVAEQAGAEAVALSAAGPGGVYVGGVTDVDNQIIVGTRVSPFSWSAERTSAGVTLAGHVPSESARKRLLETARARFSGAKITDRMIVALGAPSRDWIEIANEALQQLGKLKHGKARLVDARLAIVGEGEQAAVADVGARYDRALAPPYTLIVKDLTITGQSLGIPELGDINLSEASAETCQKAFRQIMRANVIEFQSGSAAIDAASRGLLENLARVARRCDTYSIAIAGHTDNVGDPAANMALSRARAEAVRNTLAGLGVAAERLSAEGFGQTQPRVPNSSADNRARNRRIEFTVT